MVKMANLKPYFRQKGATLIMTAFLLPVLFAALGGALDLGNLYVYKSQLQNVADSAALAGISRYSSGTSGEVQYRLTEVPNLEEDGSFTLTLGETTYHFKPDEETSGVDTQAAEYVDVNTDDDRKISLTALKTEDEDTTKLWFDENTRSRCYQVTLRNTIPTYFIRYFGIESLTTEATAVAMAYISGDDINKIIEETSKKIAETIPNYYWETIMGKGFTISNMDKRSNTVTIGSGDDQMVIKVNTDKNYYGARRYTYFTDNDSNYTQNTTDPFTSYETYTDSTITYKDRDVVKDGTSYILSACNEICALPVEADATAKDYTLRKLVYTISADLLLKGKDASGRQREITGLFLDRPRISDDKKNDELASIRETVLNITSKEISKNNEVPLYVRFESDQIRRGGSATFIAPLTINVKEENKKPMVIAYDGPDQSRTCTDAPVVDRMYPAYAYTLKNWQFTDHWDKTHRVNSDGKFADGDRYVLSSVQVSAPVTINLTKDFHGVIYAPFSEVTITGSGKINGYVLAGRIIDKGTSTTRHQLTSSTVSLPTWKLTKFEGDYFTYEVSYVDGNYHIVYDNLVDYVTNTIHVVQ